MRVPPRLFAVLAFLVVGIVALVFAGLLDWIVGVLFLSMEFLGETLRSIFRRRKDRRHPASRPRHAPVVHHHAVERPRGQARRRGRPRRRRSATRQADPAPPGIGEPRPRILVPVRGDEAGLLGYALEECRARQAEMIVLFLRPIGVMPMGPVPLPGLDEDDEARAVFDRLVEESGRLGVPLRTLYATTSDLPATIAEAAADCEVDVVILGSSRRGRRSRFLSRDLAPSVLRMLPDRASLTIRAS